MAMRTFDPDLALMIKNGEPVYVNGLYFTIEPNRAGSCEGCYFETLDRKNLCGPALQYCCSNGGNILKLTQPTEE